MADSSYTVASRTLVVPPPARPGTTDVPGAAALDAPRGRRVLVVTAHFPPDRSAGTHRVLRFTRHLAAEGWPIRVLTMDPAHYRAGTQVDPALLDAQPARVAVSRTAVFRGLAAAIRTRNRLRPVNPEAGSGSSRDRVGHARGRLQRLKDLVSDLCSFPDADVGWLPYALVAGLRLIRRHRIDVLVSSAPPFTCHLVAGLLARWAGAKWVADFRDPWARAPWSRPGFADTWQGRARRSLERWIVTRADRVLLNTAALHAEFATHYGEPLAGRLRTVTNGYDRDLLGAVLDRARPRNGHAVLTHAGTLYKHRNPLPLVEALAAAVRHGHIPPGGVELRFLGGGAESFGLPAAIERLGLAGQVILKPPVAHRRALEELATSDGLIVIQPGTHLQVPVKLYEYLPYRKPIIALAPAGAVSDLVRDGRLGWAIDPNDVDGLERALVEFYRLWQTDCAAFAPDESFIDQFDGAVTARRFREILEAL